MGRDFLCGRYCGCIFFYKILNSPNSHSASLDRIEECMLMSDTGRDSFSDFEIITERLLDFRSKIDDGLVSAFPDDADSVVPEIDVLHIEADTFRDTDTGAKKQSNDREISFTGLIIIGKSFSAQCTSAVLNVIQKNGYLIGIQANDGLFMDLRHINKNSRIRFDHFLTE